MKKMEMKTRELFEGMNVEGAVNYICDLRKRIAVGSTVLGVITIGNFLFGNMLPVPLMFLDTTVMSCLIIYTIRKCIKLDTAISLMRKMF